MRSFFTLILLAAGIMNSPAAPAQEQEGRWEIWFYEEDADPFTDEIEAVYATALARDQGSIGVTCRNGIFLVVASFLGTDSEPNHPADIKWRVNKGELMEFTTVSSRDGYGVPPPLSMELARGLTQARQFATSNGHDKVLQFEDLAGGENVARVLEACGH